MVVHQLKDFLKLFRCFFLLLLCIVLTGDYICYDSPSGILQHVIEDMGISETQYMGFFSTLQWTDIPSSLLGWGFLVDRIGNRLSMPISTGLIAASHTLFAVGALFKNYWVMWVVRALFGLVAAPSAIANDNLTVKWFQQSMLNMVMAMKTSLGRVCSVLTLNIMDPIYDFVSARTQPMYTLGVTLFTGSCCGLLCTLAAILAAVIDRRSDVQKLIDHPPVAKDDSKKEESKFIRISDVKRFPSTFWLIAISSALFYLQLFPFVTQGELFFATKYSRSPKEAITINSMVYLVGAVSMPLFGVAIDRVGRNLYFLMTRLVLGLTSHIMMTFTFVEPYVCTVILSLGYSLVTTTCWPLVSYAVPLRYLGTAFGIMGTIISVGQAIDTYFVGFIVDTAGYLVLEVFFTMCVICSMIAAALLYLRDASTDGLLNLSTKQRAVFLKHHV
ncbi:major facilitator superfamily domain-containing protein 1-like isoform X2 [Dreissena polymorpha]|uniref:Lysosomal dipeptide transporter MFSD1 n=1 Tax=Dreissena polymorpha TaxID=45954 RepID=A0A9D4FVI7_DREPO|nr:major facilitator superfamily domain-containing protein 1-like isoform X2 [Dreissena polymorpha]XP_052219135.1 major facilitator superfamily domain-containing protein 1-like isoform X2 [Dreissena polymorpha]XP_052219136.1 major facilitator superfamily domain-containing protein 1-like isoform X2 [Dreissena polymorpha]XP_052219137.1 major facilitator superfamily domain-containing protein 1-like isoform X2 [Dreissena polymorpha]XP_052219138.1 major facilitator superfamily domain-containing prot